MQEGEKMSRWACQMYIAAYKFLGSISLGAVTDCGVQTGMWRSRPQNAPYPTPAPSSPGVREIKNTSALPKMHATENTFASPGQWLSVAQQRQGRESQCGIYRHVGSSRRLPGALQFCKCCSPSGRL